MIPCPKCLSPAPSRTTMTHKGKAVYRHFKCGACFLEFDTCETVTCSRKLEGNLSPEQLERLFGKPKFKYKALPPTR
jgi:hypothetical protein